MDNSLQSLPKLKLLNHVTEFRGDTKFLKVISYAFFVFVLVLFVNATIPQLEMYLFHGTMPFSVANAKIITSISAFGIIFLKLRKKLELHVSLVISWCFFAAYILLELMILPVTPKEFLYLVGSINSVYFFVFILPFVLYLHGGLEEKTVVKTLLTLFVPLSMLGILQYVLKDPLLPVSSDLVVDFKVYSWKFKESVRAFSLFNSGYSFGHFIAFVGAIILLLPMNRFRKFILISMMIVAGYFTLTRNTYLEIIAVIFSVIFLRKHIKSPSAPYWMSALFALVGYIVMKFANEISQLFGKSDIVDTISHTMRLDEWAKASELWLHGGSGGLMTGLFGTGLGQGYGLRYVDNMYLAVGVQFGIIGLIVFGTLVLAMARYVFNEARRRQTPFSIGVAAFWTTFPIVSYFNISLEPYVLVFIFLVLTKTKQMLQTSAGGA